MNPVFFFMIKNEIMQEYDLMAIDGRTHFFSESEADETLAGILQKQLNVTSLSDISFYQDCKTGIKFCIKKFQGSI